MQDLDDVVQQFDDGLEAETGSGKPSSQYADLAKSLPGMAAAVKDLGAGRSPELAASAVEFVLEGLHLNRRLNRDRFEGGFRYPELGRMLFHTVRSADTEISQQVFTVDYEDVMEELAAHAASVFWPGPSASTLGMSGTFSPFADSHCFT